MTDVMEERGNKISYRKDNKKRIKFVISKVPFLARSKGRKDQPGVPFPDTKNQKKPNYQYGKEV